MVSVETRFTAAEDGEAWTEKFVEKGVEWFRFESRTKITLEDGCSITIRTRRRMAAGLYAYFRGAEAWRKQILRENQDHALDFYNSQPA